MFVYYLHQRVSATVVITFRVSLDQNTIHILQHMNEMRVLPLQVYSQIQYGEYLWKVIKSDTTEFDCKLGAVLCISCTCVTVN